MKLKVKDITLIAILSVVLFVQKEVLSFLPNISLTVFLIVLYSKKLGLSNTLLIIAIYCILDNLIMNSFNIIFTPFVFIGWALIPLMLNTVFKKVDNVLSLSLLGILFSFLYSWIYLIPNVLVLNVNPIAYLASDSIFEIILAISSFVSILWLYKPCSKVIDIITK